jgi:hypothetical protein
MEFLSFAAAGSLQMKRGAIRSTERLICRRSSDDLEACSKEAGANCTNDCEGEERKRGDFGVASEERGFVTLGGPEEEVSSLFWE